MRPEALRNRIQAHAAGRLLLGALALLYGAAVLLRNILYWLRLLPSRKLPVRTVCVGNLTTGGTGKTSAVLLAAQTLHKKQVSTAILSRGYGRRRKARDVQVLLNTQSARWEETGDEPWMMHRALKGTAIPILISSDRCRAGDTALTYYKPQVLLLDDGFQHRKLRRDLDIVLINAINPFGGGKLLPAGNLREPLRALRRAGLAVITHADQVPSRRLAEIRETINGYNPKLPVLEAIHRADFLLDLKRDRRRRLSHIKKKAVACFSGIGDPRPFEEQLRRIGSRLIQTWRYPDHHPYTLDELRSIESLRRGLPVLTTFKDFPRLPPGWQEILRGEVLALGIRMEITKGRPLWEEALWPPPASAKRPQDHKPASEKGREKDKTS
ncbi:MAG: tetraacyldisaccharide 4'-kinase [Elusimicrobiota bacterium]